MLGQVEQMAALAALNMLSAPHGVGVIAPSGQEWPAGQGASAAVPPAQVLPAVQIVQPLEYAPFSYTGVPLYPGAHSTRELLTRTMNMLFAVLWHVLSESEFE